MTSERVFAGSDRGVFAERLLQIVDEGQRTATYKLALLLALMDLCATDAGADGAAPEALTTREVAERVLELYWPQTRLYEHAGDTTVLRQITMKNSAALEAVTRLRTAADACGLGSLTSVTTVLPVDHERAVRQVEYTFARYPILLLQVVGRQDAPFIYDVDWDGRITPSQLARQAGTLIFRAGAGDELVRLTPLLRPLIELHWTRMVASINRLDLEQSRLRDHLFGAERTPIPRSLRHALADLQERRCFYCRELLTGPQEVDHFIPWARWPNDAVENLVLADRRCNTSKRHHLGAAPHLRRWLDRQHAHQATLANAAHHAGWESAPERTTAITRSCYAHVPMHTPLWLNIDTFVPADATLVSLLGTR